MLSFWIIAVAMTAMAVAVLMPALLGRSKHSGVTREALNLAIYKERLAELDLDQTDLAQRERTRQEIERELLEDLEGGDEKPGKPAPSGSRAVAVLVAIAVPVLSIAVYAQLGSPEALERSAAPPAMASAQGLPADHPKVAGDQAMPSLEDMAAGLAERLVSEPDNLEGWVMLGRSYLVLKQAEPAREAFGRAYQLAPDKPEILVRYVEASALAQNGSMRGKPAELVAKLLQMAPQHPNGLWMAGLAAYQQADYQQAVTHWSKLAAMLKPGPEADMLAQQLADARSQLAGGAATGAATVTAAAPAPEPAPQAVGAELAVEVSLAPELVAQASPADTVFIFARAAEGPRMPLAIVRRSVGELPVSVTLDDSMAMTPELKLSNFQDVVVGARVSKSGTAIPQSGDLEGLTPPIPVPRDQPVKVTIDRAI